MKFCPECGSGIEGMKFCPECGYKIEKAASQPQPQSQPPSQPANDAGEQIISQFETKLLIGGGFEKNIVGDVNLSRSKDKYTLTTERLIIERKGMIRSKREEIEGYKIQDIQVKQGIKDKALNVGDITILSTDPITPKYILKSIENPQVIADQLRTLARNAKKDMNIIHHQNI